MRQHVKINVRKSAALGAANRKSVPAFDDRRWTMDGHILVDCPSSIVWSSRNGYMIHYT
jgi:hypothetical protein